MLGKKLEDEKAEYLRSAYDSVFEDDSIKDEQRSTALCLEKSGNAGGQEW